MIDAETLAPHRPATAIPGGGLADTRERWRVLYQQLQSGQEPCFRTSLRLTCTDEECPLRARCIGLRAEWRR